MHHRSLTRLLKTSSTHLLRSLATEMASLTTHILLLVSLLPDRRSHTTLSDTTSHTASHTTLWRLLWHGLGVATGIVTGVSTLDWSLWVGVIWSFLGVVDRKSVV